LGEHAGVTAIFARRDYRLGRKQLHAFRAFSRTPNQPAGSAIKLIPSRSRPCWIFMMVEKLCCVIPFRRGTPNPDPPPASLSRKRIPAFSKADWIRIRSSCRSQQLLGGAYLACFGRWRLRSRTPELPGQPNWVRFVNSHLTGLWFRERDQGSPSLHGSPPQTRNILHERDAPLWPFSTGRIFQAGCRFRDIADVAGPATCPAQSRLTHGNRRTAPPKRGCAGPGSARISYRHGCQALILIAAPFSSRLSRYRSAISRGALWCIQVVNGYGSI
jgi:hypothetical protein